MTTSGRTAASKPAEAAISPSVFDLKRYRRFNHRAISLWVTYVLVLPFFRKFTFFNEIGLFGQLEELLLLLLVPAALNGLKILAALRTGRLFLLSFLTYLLLGAVSWVGSGVPAPAAALQFLLELKFPFVVCAFVGIGDAGELYARFLRLMKALLVVSVPLIFLQFSLPHVYTKIFPTEAAQGMFRTLGPGTLPRATGAFWFSGQLAFFSAIVTGLFFIRARLHPTMRNWAWSFTGLAVLLSTLQRQEILGTLLLLPFLMLLLHRGRVPGDKTIVALLLATGGVLVLLPFAPLLVKYIAVTSRRLGLATPEASGVARVLFYVKGFQLANQEFPLGAGLGSFAGHAAALFGSPVYDRLGFTSLSWFQQGRRMTDTFWPHVYGEAGWLGLLAYLTSLGSLLALLWHRFRLNWSKANRFYSGVALFSFLFLLNVSLTSPVMTSMLPLGMSFLFTGVLHRELARKRWRSYPNP